jgi:hypothetical protein
MVDQHISEKPRDVPRNWGEDELTAFIELARAHLFGTFHNLIPEFNSLRWVDEAFLRFIKGWKDPENPSTVTLVPRAHSAFRAATQLSLSGQVPEAYMVMRGCLEYALYANHMAIEAAAFEAWRRRGDDAASRKKCAREFSGARLFASLRKQDTVVADRAGMLYERTIDFGAHPNELAVGSLMRVEQSDTEATINHAYLSGEGMPLRLCLKSLGQTGLIALEIFCLIYPKRCKAALVAETVAAFKPRF